MTPKHSPAPVWLAQPAATWTGNSEDAGNGIVVQGNRIIELVPAGAMPTTRGYSHFDARGLALLPGLINCHHHFYQTLTRAFPGAQNRELFDWLKALYPVWARIGEDGIHTATRLALAELLLSGCTTSVDHHYLFSSDTGNAIDAQADAAASMGARVVLTRGSMSLGVADGGLPPDSVVQTADTILADSERLINRYHQRGDDAMVQIALAPCSPFSVTPELMREVASLATRHDVLLHTHLAETADENTFCERQLGMRPLAYLESVGWLNDRVWLAHGIHFNDAEIQSLAQAGVGVCHCPSSNMILASGICRVRELEQAGVNVGLGVDGSASNDHSNMMQEVRQAFLLQRLRYGSAAITADDALRWATVGGARLLKRPGLGQLAVGMVADIALFDPAQDLRFSGAADLIGALVTSGAHAARHVMVNGHWRVRDYTLADTDLAELRASHEALARRLRR